VGGSTDGELGGVRAVSGESSDDLSHVDVGSGNILGGGTSDKASGSDGGSETHVDGVEVGGADGGEVDGTDGGAAVG